MVIQIPNHPESEFFGGKKILELAKFRVWLANGALIVFDIEKKVVLIVLKNLDVKSFLEYLGQGYVVFELPHSKCSTSLPNIILDGASITRWGKKATEWAWGS